MSAGRGAGIDFEREGLLASCTDDEERRARRDLLAELAAGGVPLDELRNAVAEDRLALVPVERALGGDGRYTARDIAARTGLAVDFLLTQWQALGLGRPGEDDRGFSEEDLRAAEALRRFRDAGLSEEGILEASRVMGQAMATVAAAIRRLVGEALLRPGDTELDLGRRYADAAKGLGPLMAPVLEYLFRAYLRDGIRRDVVGRAERESGRLPGAADVGVAFADLVGFTRLGERLSAGELGALAGRLAAMAADVVEPPVQLVKTIGDAAMLVSPEPAPLLDAALDLVAMADDEDEDFPQLRAGLAYGPALVRGGDWYGQPVNLASRVTAVARPASVLTTAELREAVGDGYRWSRAPDRRLKGIEGRVRLYRARRDPDGAGDPDAGPGEDVSEPARGAAR